MVRHLRAQGLPVVTVVPDREGRFVVPIRAPEGQRWGVLFEDVGVPWRPRLEAKRARAIGRIMADIHIAADALPEVPRMRIDFDAMFRRPPRVLAPFLADAPAVLEELEQLCEALAEHVRPLLPHDGGWGFCHGDLHLGNVFFDHDHRPFVIDFDHALHGYRAFDLAIHLCSLGPAAFYDAVGRSVRRTWWKNVFAGYDERIAPGPDFRPLVEALIPARMLVFACYMAQAVDTWGARILEPQRIRILLRITRLWAREARVPLPKALDEPTSASVLDAMIMRPSPFVLPPMGLRP